jgi:hypothetical protein
LKRKSKSQKSSAGQALAKSSEGAPSQKRSITLYQTDLDILDSIRAFFHRNGIRNLSDSEAIRLACRTASLDSTLIETYETMKREDGRRRGYHGARPLDQNTL